VLQNRVSELGQLAAYISLDLKTENQTRIQQAQLHFASLEKWQSTLPPSTQLNRLRISDSCPMNWHTKRSLLHLHILFLGLFTEPYRNHLVALARFRLGDISFDSEKIQVMQAVEERCVMAARQSARVASLLQIDNLIRSGCWISVYVT
jgi:hypothetical protein